MEAAYAKNPYSTKTEARRGVNSKEARAERGSISDTQDRTQKNIKAKISNVNLRQELGIVSRQEGDKLREQLKGMGKEIKNLYENLVVGTRAYHAATEGIKATYDDLYMQGIIGDIDDDPWGDIFYH